MSAPVSSTSPPPHRRQLWIVLAILVLVPAGYLGLRAVAAGKKPDFHQRFAVVDPGKLLRSSQPSPADLDWVKNNHGLKTIVVLRSRPGFSLGGSWWDEEQAWAGAHEVEVEYLPCDADDPPSAYEIERFFKLFQDPARQPVLIHCEAGRHRTGVYAALYGRTFLGWSTEQALKDLYDHGFGEANKRQKLVDVVKNFTPPASQPTRADGEKPAR